MRRTGVGVLVAIALAIVGLTVSQGASATPFTGTFGPTIFNGLADVDGSGSVTSNDDSNGFFDDTDIINGGVDCDAWAGPNDGAAGDGVIDGGDDCELTAFDGSANGATITIVNGSFQAIDGTPIANGTPLPHIFPDAGDPANGDIGDSWVAWSTINGRVDANGNEVIDSGDCSNDLVGTANVLSNGQVAECGFAVAPTPDVNGLVDLSDDFAITAADSCTTGCFFGHDVLNGVVQVESAGATPTPTPSASPTASPTPAPNPTGTIVTIGDGGTRVTAKQDCHFTVTVTPASNTTVTVNYVATATNAKQIAATSGTLVFAPGATVQTVVVDVLKKRRKIGVVEVTLSGPTGGAKLADGVGRCTIRKRSG